MESDKSKSWLKIGQSFSAVANTKIKEKKKKKEKKERKRDKKNRDKKESASRSNEDPLQSYPLSKQLNLPKKESPISIHKNLSILKEFKIPIYAKNSNEKYTYTVYGSALRA